MRLPALLWFALAATAVKAEPASVTGGHIMRLTPAEIEAALDAAATHHPDPLNELAADPPVARSDRAPHGEVGAFVGSGGTRGVWGSTLMPLGQGGTLGLSFSTGRYPGYRDWRY